RQRKSRCDGQTELWTLYEERSWSREMHISERYDGREGITKVLEEGFLALRSFKAYGVRCSYIDELESRIRSLESNINASSRSAGVPFGQVLITERKSYIMLTLN